MTRFLPGYEQQIVNGAGLNAGPGADKVVIHTTETGPGSVDPLIRHWTRNPGTGLPHFVAEGPRYVQLLPLDVAAYTLENAPGGADTNRSGPAIQVEIVTYAANGLNDVEVEALGKWLADLVRAGVDLDLAQHPRFYGANEGIVLASYTSPIRMGAQEYNAFNGFCGHQHTPENAHWDPGKLDGDRVERIARQHLGEGTVPKPPPPPSEEDDDMLKAPRTSWKTKDKGEWFALNPDGRFVYINGGATLAALQTPHEGHPAEIAAPIEIQDRGVANTLAEFYNGQRLD